jgi:copper homeostasis protein
MKNFLFELCAESVEAARAAESGGADRIELCSELTIGGTTPDIELIRSAIQALSIPVHVLIRPRGGDFVFSDEEFGQMLRQIEEAKKAGAAGIAIGVLLADGRVDIERSRELVRAGRPMNITFHRAFDETNDLAEALEAVILTEADCLLTSGGAPNVLAGAESIARLRRQAGKRLNIMAGGGLRLSNLVEVVRRAEVSYLHGSLTRPRVEIEADAGSNGHGAMSGPEILEADVRESVRLLRDEVRTREFAASTSL